MPPEDFRSRLLSVLDQELLSCRRELASHRAEGRTEDVLSFGRGAIQAVEVLARSCYTKECFLEIMTACSDRVSCLAEEYLRDEGDARKKLAYLWWAGGFVQMDMVAQRLRIYARL